jgi:hypothetical protein
VEAAHTVAALQEFLEAHPDTRCAAQARVKIEDLRWADADGSATPPSLDAYLRDYPQSRYAEQARAQIDELDWQTAGQRDLAADYQHYLDVHPNGAHAAAARGRIDDLPWQSALASGTVQAYEQYLREHPGGKYAAQAARQIDEFQFRATQRSDTREAYRQYLTDYPAGAHVMDALNRIEDLDFATAVQGNTIASYQAYLAGYAMGRHANEATTYIGRLAADDAPFLAADQQATQAAYQAFLASYPGHQRAADARDRIADLDGRDLFDAIALGKVQVTSANGTGSRNVALSLRSAVGNPVVARIPAGTVFVSGTAQSLVATGDTQITVPGNQSVATTVPAAYTNMVAVVPSAAVSFTAQRGPPSADLQQLLPVLSQENPQSPAVQAAVWIVNRNATYSSMQTLVTLPNNARVISNSDAARGMQLVDAAGFNIKTKAIWGERSAIYSALQDGPVKAWLKQKAGF